MKQKQRDIFYIREYHEQIHIEDAFHIFQKARLNMYRLSELEDYILEKGYNKEKGWKYWKLKIKTRKEAFHALEKQVGVKQNPKPIGKPTYVQNDIKEIINLVHAYLKLNYKMEKTLLSILEAITRFIRTSYEEVLLLLENHFKGMAKFLNEKKIYHLDIDLDKVSTESDKIITYEITSKDKQITKALNAFPKGRLFLKVRDHEFNIQKGYEDVKKYEKLLSNIILKNMEFIEAIENKKKENMNDKRNFTAWMIGLLALLFATYQSLTSTISILQNDGMRLKEIVSFFKTILFYTLRII